jgi:hypothetical protein
MCIRETVLIAALLLLRQKKKAIQQHVIDMLAESIIEVTSFPYSPIVMDAKKDGRYRFALTIGDSTASRNYSVQLLPVIHEVLKDLWYATLL